MDAGDFHEDAVTVGRGGRAPLEALLDQFVLRWRTLVRDGRTSVGAYFIIHSSGFSHLVIVPFGTIRTHLFALASPACEVHRALQVVAD